MDYPIVYIDLDGVCSDLLGSLYKIMGVTFPPPKWATNNAEAKKIFGFYGKELWAEVESRNPRFWSELPAYPWFSSLWKKLEEVSKPIIVTSPSYSSRSVAGKVEWIKKNLGENFRDFHLTYNREHLARPGRFLIDDAPVNIELFEKYGGTGILFPQPWNTPGADPYQWVLNNSWIEQIKENYS